MMNEIETGRQYKGSLKRRWFSDDYFDLILWENKNKDIVRFELCYGKNKDEHALVWNQESGHSHVKVDDGDSITDGFKMSPIFVADGIFDRETIAARFLQASRTIDKEVASFVYNRLAEFNKPTDKG